MEFNGNEIQITEDQLLRDVRLGAPFISDTDDFRLVTWDTYRMDRRGCCYVGYALIHGETVIFEGEDYSPGPMSGIDSDDAVRSLIGFLSLQPGDTDDEYFENYTTVQLEFAETYGENLSMYGVEDDDGECVEPLNDWTG
jgi:hypothetical protein